MNYTTSFNQIKLTNATTLDAGISCKPTVLNFLSPSIKGMCMYLVLNYSKFPNCLLMLYNYEFYYIPQLKQP